MKLLHTRAEKDPNTGRNKTLIELDADDSLILEQALRSFDKYDKDDKKYTTKLDHVKEQVHKTWALLHPS